VLAIYGSAEATEHLSFEPRTREQVAQIVARSIASATATPRTEYALAVIERNMNELIGFGRLATDPHQQRGATLGFALRPDAWGVGYGVETVRLLLSVGFDDLGVGAPVRRNQQDAVLQGQAPRPTSADRVCSFPAHGGHELAEAARAQPGERAYLGRL
jgi:hypothetical protein